LEGIKLKEKNNPSKSDIQPHLFIIFGATGNLSRNKLFPAIYTLSAKGILKGKNKVLGVARKIISDQDFRVQSRDILTEVGMKVDPKIYIPWCKACLYYNSIGKGKVNDYKKLATRIKKIEKENELTGNRIFYLALPPRVLESTIRSLGKAGLNKSKGWTRLVIEKPFGTDLKTAQSLNSLLNSYFDESQIYRIDHFLGKETVQNLLVFRFANAVFEHLWNRDHIESVEITVAENIGIEGRAHYFEQIGTLRDMIQNHLTQLLTLIAMEAPIAFEAEAIRNEKAKILKQVVPIKKKDVVFGQYGPGKIDGKKVPGYLEEPGIPADSKTETYVTLKLYIANWRWEGVPFILKTGKRLPKRLTEIVINFHNAPISIFNPLEEKNPIEPNNLTLALQPDEGFDLKFQVKAIGEPIKTSTQKLHFKYSEAFGSLSDAYETLLLDVITGDQTLFVRYDEVETSWKIYDHLLKEKISLKLYSAGSNGPV
jgi:glucose-6-phosphate 1-dehydrogenase